MTLAKAECYTDFTFFVRNKAQKGIEIMRLDKAVSLAGLTRSEAKKAISSGRVLVNGQIAKDTGMQVDPADVFVDGNPVENTGEVYIMINKPAGVITATEDKKLPVVTDLLPDNIRKKKIGPVGRLDRDVTGLVIITSDGQMAHRLISPKWKAEKLYRAKCEGRLESLDVAIFAAGIELSDFTAKPAKMTILSAGEESIADVVLTEGKFHQVKRMFSAIGHPLISLERLRIGCIELDPSLKPGEYRFLTEDEVHDLKALCNMNGEE